MGTRSVRLDDEAERILARLRKLTGLSISEVLTRGLIAYETKALQNSTLIRYEIYRQLDFGQSGYAVAPARQAKSELRAVIQRKHAR